MLESISVDISKHDPKNATAKGSATDSEVPQAVVGRAGRREPALYRKPHELVIVEREDETA